LKDEGTILRADYPYTDDEAACYANSLERQFYLTQEYAYDLAGGDLNEFKQFLRLGAIGIAFAVSSSWFQYGSGVYTDSDGCAGSINHGMVAMGYGTDAETGLDYVLIRNSWGADWGDMGYGRVAISQLD